MRRAGARLDSGAGPYSAPPLDVVEMLVWGREGAVATYKHPNLPGLLLEAVRRLSFGAFWPAYALAQACVVASFITVYLLGRDLLGPGRPEAKRTANTVTHVTGL